MYYRSFEQIGTFSSEIPVKCDLVMGNVKAVYDGEQYLLNAEDYYLKHKLIQYLRERAW